MLKLETTGTCYAISAKRYVIYHQTDDGTIKILKRSEHGLGRYLNPLDPDEEQPDGAPRSWIDDAWRWILNAHDDPHTPLPDWGDKPALSRITISSPLLRRPFTTWNRRKQWAQQIKPFNFILVATLDPFALPEHASPERFRLIAPYGRDSRNWTRPRWRNMYDPDGPTYGITTDRDDPYASAVLVKSYGQVLREYRLHPEHKFLAPDGHACRYLTRGLLQRRTVHLAGTVHLIGKEANKLDEVQAGLHSELADVVTEYPCPNTPVLQRLVLPVLARYSGHELAALVGVDPRTIHRIRHGQQPRPRLATDLLRIAIKLAKQDLASRRVTPDLTATSLKPIRDLAVLEMWRRHHSSVDPHS